MRAFLIPALAVATLVCLVGTITAELMAERFAWLCGAAVNFGLLEIVFRQGRPVRTAHPVTVGAELVGTDVVLTMRTLSPARVYRLVLNPEQAGTVAVRLSLLTGNALAVRAARHRAAVRPGNN